MRSASPAHPTALVTGANRGLGLETSIQLKADGFRVIPTSRTESEGIAATQKLDPDGKDVLYHQLDITDGDSIATLAKDLPRLVSQLDVLVNAVCPGGVRTDVGGGGATRGVPVGGRSIALGVTLPKDSTGGFSRDGKRIPW